ncbi:ECF RNA polymerase sigma-E factor [compost metagenome]
MHDSEEQLIQQAQAGNRQAFGALMQRNQARVFQFVRRLCAGGDEALDITQDTFLKAYLALGKWRPEARFQTWLLQIARNTTLDALRQQRRQPCAALEDCARLVSPVASPEQQLAGAQRLALLERLLARLPLEHREILLLREVEGLTYAELATTLEIQPGTVKSRLARAREAMLSSYRHANGGQLDD